MGLPGLPFTPRQALPIDHRARQEVEKVSVNWDNIDELTEGLEAEGVVIVNEFEEARLTEEFIAHVEKNSKLPELQDGLGLAENTEDYVGMLLIPSYLSFTGTKTFTMEGLKLKILTIHGIIFAGRHKALEEWAMRLRIRGL